jgi:hypothetical protein
LNVTHYRSETPRKAGRPKKDEIIVRKLTVHKSKGIKPENMVKYAKETINTANGLYRRYSKPYPNPLNIDEKDLLPEARACWEYIFSTREYDGIPELNGKANIERVFYNAEEVNYAFECYADWVKSQNFVKTFVRPDGEDGVMPIIPNQSNFARWLGVSNQTVHNVMFRDEEARNTYKRILGDLLSEGAMAGIYQSVSTIFTLKNMCDWADKYEDRSTNRSDDLGVAEAEALMKQLGYAREKAKLEPPKPMLEGDVDG